MSDHTISTRDGWFACTCGEGGRGDGQAHLAVAETEPEAFTPAALLSATPVPVMTRAWVPRHTNGRTVWLPPGLACTPPPDRRRFNAPEAPWDITFTECRDNPGTWHLACVTDRAPSLAHRIKNGLYAGTKHGTWTTTQRSVGDELAALWVKYEEAT